MVGYGLMASLNQYNVLDTAIAVAKLSARINTRLICVAEAF